MTGLAWTDRHAPIAGSGSPISKLRPADVGAELDGEIERPEPSILRRRDRVALLYEAMIAFVFGARGVGKSWLTVEAGAQQLRGGRHVMVLDYEDTLGSYLGRLRTLGVPDDALRLRFHYFRMVDPLTEADVDRLVRFVQAVDVSLVVIDSLGEAFGVEGINENHDNEVAPWLRQVPRRLADAGAAVVLVDHVTKAAEAPRDPSGTKRKGAAAQVMYRVDEIAPLAIGQTGRLRVICTKDRHGQFAAGEHVADFVMVSTDLGTTRVDLYEPSGSTGTTTRDRVETAVLEAVREHPGINLGGIEGVVEGKAATIRRSIEALVVRGEVVEGRGPRGARQFSPGVVE